MPDWTHKDIWRRRAPTYSVEIEHFTVPADIILADDGNRWTVNAYIYPFHPLFAVFEGESHSQPALANMPLHGSCLSHVSLVRFHYRHEDLGNPTCVQVGADYNHLHDERFAHYETREDAAEVFADAERLIVWLSEYEA